MHLTIKQNKTRQNKTKQNKTKQHKTKQNKTKQQVNEDKKLSIEQQLLVNKNHLAVEKKSLCIKQKSKGQESTGSVQGTLSDKRLFGDGLAIVSSLCEDRNCLFEDTLSLSEEDVSCKDKSSESAHRPFAKSQEAIENSLSMLQSIDNHVNVSTIRVLSPLSRSTPTGASPYPISDTPPDIASNPPQIGSHSIEDVLRATAQDEDDISEEHLRQMLLVSQQINRELKKTPNNKASLLTCIGTSMKQMEMLNTSNSPNCNNKLQTSAAKSGKVKQEESGQETCELGGRRSAHNDKLYNSASSVNLEPLVVACREERNQKSFQTQHTAQFCNKDIVKGRAFNDSSIYTCRDMKRKVSSIIENALQKKKLRKPDENVASFKQHSQSCLTDVHQLDQTCFSNKRKRSQSSSQSKRVKCSRKDKSKSVEKKETSQIRSKLSNNENSLTRQMSSNVVMLPQKPCDAGLSIPVVPNESTRHNPYNQFSKSVNVPIVSNLAQHYSVSNSYFIGSNALHTVMHMDNNKQTLTHQQIAQQQLMFNMALHRRQYFPSRNPYMNSFNVYTDYYHHVNQRY